MQQIRPCLWFEREAEEAATLYTSIFPNSRVTSVARFGEGGHGPAGQAMSATFELDGQPFLALNGRPQLGFTEAISLVVGCDSQDEIDRYWDQLVAGGEASQCDWLKDRFGVSWQIVPSALETMLGDADAERAGRVMQAMLAMSKFDLGALQRAYDGS